MDSSSSRRRSLRDLDGGGGDDDDLEEGEYVPGRDESSEDTDGGDGYRLKRRLEGELGRRVSWQEVAMASGQRVGVPRPLVARSSCESDGTISDDDGVSNPSADSSEAVISSDGAPAALRFECHVCGRGFSSPKAVDGHMRVHGNGRQVAAAAAVSGGWAATGKRGWAGGKPSLAEASLNSESTDDHSTAVVVAQPMPMAIAVTNPSPMPALSSTGTSLSGEESSNSATAQPMDYEPPAVATAGPSPSTGAVVHHQQAAPPPPAAEQARFVQQPAVPPAAANLAQLPRRVYSCKLCGKSYASHQGLGGHAAGHRNRQKEAEAAAAAAEGIMMGLGQDGGAFLAELRRGRRAEEPHECQKCHKVFATGVALGGHMRMHYTGPPIVHKKHKRRCVVALAPAPAPALSEADLRLALSTVTEERRPAVAVGRVRLFGIDIGPQVQAPPSKEEEQGSTTAEGSSSESEKQQ